MVRQDVAQGENEADSLRQQQEHEGNGGSAADELSLCIHRRSTEEKAEAVVLSKCKEKNTFFGFGQGAPDTPATLPYQRPASQTWPNLTISSIFSM